ncbi:MAG: hypothetical protein OHK0046_22440 [Anaerolineae bacterium]
MANLEVVFEVPKFIERGLASGTLERVGGVIRDTASKQIIAWLREGSVVQDAVRVGSGLPSPFGLIANVIQGALTLYDGQKTREAIDALSQQVHTVSALTAATAAGQLVNLALASASFKAILTRLDRLSSSVEALGGLVQTEFEHDRDISFRKALQAARDTVDIQDNLHRSEAARSAIDGLYEARENFMRHFDERLSENLIRDDHLLACQRLLTRAMYADIGRIRCYAYTDEQVTRERLAESLTLFRPAVEKLLQAWIGRYPSIYFHQETPAFLLDRFFQVQFWLNRSSSDQDATLPRIMFRIVDEVRKDFWNEEVIKQEYSNFINQIRRRPVRTKTERTTELHNRLAQAEIMIENFQRMEGLDLELRAMRLSGMSFSEWESIFIKEIDEKGFGIVVNRDLINQFRSNRR